MERFSEPPGGFDRRGRIHSGRDAHPIEQVQQILGCDVASGVRGERASTGSPDGRIECEDSAPVRGHHICHRRVPGVVEVAPQRDVGGGADRSNRGLDLRRDGDADRVAEGDLVGACGCRTIGQPDDVVEGHLPFVGAAEGNRNRDRRRSSAQTLVAF